MDELYQAIEDKIAASGYPGKINGYEIYNEICDEIEEKEEGTYLFFTKPNETDVFEYEVTVKEENFNLGKLTITSDNTVYCIDFDAE